MRLTVGPLPAAVYWRRRALVLGAALLVVFLIAQACIAASAEPGGETTGGETPGPGHQAIGGVVGLPPQPDPAGDPDGQSSQVSGEDEPAPDAEQCGDEEMLITAEVRAPGGGSRTEFTADEQVEFWIIIRNDSDRTCQRNIGGAHRELYLIQGSGASRFWTSRDCAAPSGEDVQQLAPNFEASHYLVWNGRSSSTCDGDDQPSGARAAPGEYELYARLGSARSEPVHLTIN